MSPEGAISFLFVVKIIAIVLLFSVCLNNNLAKQKQSLYLGVIELFLFAANGAMGFIERATGNEASAALSFLLVLVWGVLASFNFVNAFKKDAPKEDQSGQ